MKHSTNTQLKNKVLKIKHNFIDIKESFLNLVSERITLLQSFFEIKNTQKGGMKMEEYTNKEEQGYINLAEQTQELRQDNESFDLMKATELPNMSIPGLNI